MKHSRTTVLGVCLIMLPISAQVWAQRSGEITAELRENPVLSVSGSDVMLPANNPASLYSYALDVSRLFERGQKRR